MIKDEFDDIDDDLELDDEEIEKLFNDHAEDMGLGDVPPYDPNEDFILDKYGKERRRCRRIKNDSKRCKSYVWAETDYCRIHGGRLIETRMLKGQIATRKVLPFKEFFNERVDLYIKELRLGHLRYSIDKEIAAMKAIDDYNDAVLQEIDAPNMKDIERSVRMKERVASLIDKMTDIESKRQFNVTANTLKIMLQEVITLVRAEIKSPREQARLLRGFKEIFAPDKMVLEGPPESPDYEISTSSTYIEGEIGS